MAILPFLVGIIALSAIITGVWSSAGRSSGEPLLRANTERSIEAQARLVVSRITQCQFEYPEGNNGTSYRLALPAGTVLTNVSAISCPGAGANWLWASGVNLPPPPSGYGNWQYINDATSARIQISGDAAILTSVATRIGSGASVSGSILTVIVQG